ncbi:hypothetical protein ACQPW3_11815 [Actinosynnema sp. CA-248983]
MRRPTDLSVAQVGQQGADAAVEVVADEADGRHGGVDRVGDLLAPIATAKIEDLVVELATRFTIIIVTHNMQQAARVSQRTGFFTAEADDKGHRTGRLVEVATTEHNPSDARTEAYITGRFGRHGPVADPGVGLRQLPSSTSAAAALIAEKLGVPVRR